ncbi:site-specific integrase [Bradyrhizobium sp. CCBAU 51765]|uniref:tyrosine-type recombinase/integrase n=1 Tax=Bradyrhizobium sp. CCBAU 51765 TaxID=1325102 RepID=UPI001889A9ED|nr:site-specific integrase [Bradyrhizobium sp. CCBAU 51765]QOZ06664.1 site-specific integrase [Bradyrhizobium sp. CCBAU 51765]
MASIRKRVLKPTKTGKRKTVWQVDYKDNQGKRRHRQFPTRREADEWLVEARGEVAAGTHVAATASKTFKEVATAWIADCKANGRERTTTDVYEQRHRDYSGPLWDDRKIGTLSVADAKQLYEDILDRSRSHEIVRRVRIEVGAILQFAQSKGWLVKNVIHLTPYKVKKRKKRPPMPTVEEVQALIQATTEQWPDYLAMLFVLVFAGLRGSELRGLCWSDIDFKRMLISISRRADKFGVIGDPKSESGTREIVMNKTTAKALKEWKLKCPKSALGLVFPTSRGTPQNHANLMNRWLRLAQIEAGVTRIRIKPDKNGKQISVGVAKYGMHALRHFCAALWIESDFSPKRISVMMGHSTVAFTFDTYGYLFEARMNVDKARDRAESIVMAG